MVPSPNLDTEFVDIVARDLQRNKLASYLFILFLVYVLWTSIDQIKENGFTLKKARSRRYPTETMTDADYADDLPLLAHIPVQTESLLP